MSNQPIALRHPVYLDASMLMAFLATLENGVAMTSEIAQKQTGNRSDGFTGEGTIALPSIAEVLGLKLGASGEYSNSTGSESSAEQKFVRQHTVASLFNRLYAALMHYGLLKVVEDYGGLADVRPGDIVQISGLVQENPIEIILDTTDRIIPFLEKFAMSSEQRGQPGNRAARRSMSKEQIIAFESQAAAAKVDQEKVKLGMEAVTLLREDLQESPVADLVLRAADHAGLLVANREFFTPATKATIIGGRFSAIGKVIEVNANADARTEIVRRGAVAGMTPMVELLLSFAGTFDKFVKFESLDTMIEGPCIQVIPLAIFA